MTRRREVNVYQWPFPVLVNIADIEVQLGGRFLILGYIMMCGPSSIFLCNDAHDYISAYQPL